MYKKIASFLEINTTADTIISDGFAFIGDALPSCIVFDNAIAAFGLG